MTVETAFSPPSLGMDEDRTHINNEAGVIEGEQTEKRVTIKINKTMVLQNNTDRDAPNVAIYQKSSCLCKLLMM